MSTSATSSAIAGRGVRRPTSVSDPEIVVVESSTPEDLWCYSPGICVTPSGRLIATMDFGGPGVARLSGARSTIGDAGGSNQGRILVSDDRGLTWQPRAKMPFLHARPFVSGGDIYVLGHSGDLMITRSTDGGDTWEEAVRLTRGETWEQAPSNVHYANDSVYLVMEKWQRQDEGSVRSNGYAPIMMRARIGADLRDAGSWTFASSLTFRDMCPTQEVPYMGLPFLQFSLGPEDAVVPGRHPWPLGFLESQIVQITDPDHYWYDPSGRTFHLFARATTNTTNLAAVVEVREHEDGTMTTGLVHAPTGVSQLFLPLPGGQMKFHIVHDAPSERYWLVSTLATDTMTRLDRLPENRFNSPNDERQHLQLHYSRNGVDWCFAGLVASGATPRESRHYASMVIDGDDLLVLSRSGDEKAISAHNGNLITFHRIRDFRRLAVL